jgi:chromosome segregation protein
VLLVEDLDAAARVRDLAPGFTAVTLAGEVLASDGTLTGGVLEGPGSGALQKKREIAELAETVAATEARYNELLTRHYALQKQILHTEELLKGLQKHHHEEELVRSALEKDLHQASEQLARFRERIGQLVRDSDALEEALARVDRDEESARGESAHAQAERAAREDRARDLQDRLEGLQRSAEAHGQELMALRVKVASHAERAGAARASLGEVSSGLAELAERQSRALEARAQAVIRREELQGRISTAEEGHAGRLSGSPGDTARLEEGRRSHGEETARVHADEASLRDERTRLDGVTEGLGQITPARALARAGGGAPGPLGGRATPDRPRRGASPLPHPPAAGGQRGAAAPRPARTAGAAGGDQPHRHRGARRGRPAARLPRRSEEGPRGEHQGPPRRDREDRPHQP